MKKYIILFYLVIALILLNYWNLFYHHPSTSAPLQNTTIKERQYYDSTDVLLPDNQDSIDSLYTDSVKQQKNDKMNDKIGHTLAKAYVDLSQV